jgi:hypothetical protein
VGLFYGEVCEAGTRYAICICDVMFKPTAMLDSAVLLSVGFWLLVGVALIRAG